MLRSRLSQVSFAILALAICTRGLYATPASPLLPTFTPTGAVSLSYQKGSPGTAGAQVTVSLATATVAAAPANSTFYTIDPATIPIWLSVDASNGTVVSPITTGAVAGTPSVFHLVASSVANSLGAGIYSATVQVNVLSTLPLSIPVTLLIKDPAATLSVNQGNTVLSALTWSVGAAQAPFTFTLASNNQPISYTSTLSALAGTTITTGIRASPASGLAYTWGTVVSVTLDPLVYAKAQAGDIITGTVTINCPTSTPSSIALSLSLTVLPPVAAITTLYPAATPVDTTALDVVNVVISGSGFVASGAGQITEVFANGTQLVSGVVVVNSTTITLAITVGATNYFAAAGTPLVLGVVNPNGGTPAAPVSPGPASANLAVVSVPIVYSITSASTFLQSGAASNTFAPYDFISIFGTNFCPDCGGSNPALLTGVPDSTYFRYGQSLSPDPGVGQHYLTVQFNKHSDHSLIAQGYLVFANNSQINVLVPAAVTTVSPSLIGAGTVEVVVSYGLTVPPAAPLLADSSTATIVGIAAADPGVFTVNSDGVGQGAILNADFSLNTSTNAALHTTGTVLVYMTGLGAPASTAGNVASATALAYPGSCISALGVAAVAGPPAVAAITGYMTTVNTAVTGYVVPSPAWTSLDGAVIQSAKIVATHFPPCNPSVTASIAGVAATVAYGGWVADSVAGLYQVNITVPATAVPAGTPVGGLVSPISVPVLVTVGGKTSQAGVTLWVK